MNHVRTFLFITFFFNPFLRLLSQSNLSIGSWKSHLSYKVGNNVTQSDDKVYYSSEKGIISLDKEDLSVDFLAKEDGLTEVDVSKLKYDKNNDQLIVAYINSNIDIIKDDEVINLPFIETNTSILGSKVINDLYLADDKSAYFATDFGILGFDLEALEFSSTTFTSLKINTIVELAGILYAGTDEGLFEVEYKTKNISDFNLWNKVSGQNGLPVLAKVKALAVQYNTVYAIVNDQLYKRGSDGNYIKIFEPEPASDVIQFLSSDGTTLMIGVEDNNNESRVFFMNPDDTFIVRGKKCVSRARYAIEDQKGRIWYADAWDPIKYTETKIDSECKKISFAVPFANDASNVKFKKSKAYLASNGVNDDFQYKGTRFGFYTLENGQWANFNQDNVPLMQSSDFINLYAIAPHPKEDKVYLGSYYSGVMLYDETDGNTKLWNKDNSILAGVVGDELRTRIAGLAFDKNENLWISNYGAPRPLVVKTKDDKWFNFNVPGSTTLEDIVIDAQGNKWVSVVGIGNGILVFNEGQDLEDKKDDKIRYITKSNSELGGNKVNGLVIDLDGSVWVGTDRGPVVFDCGDPFNSNCRGNTRKVVVDNIPAPLLKDEDVLCIEIDGANRKWFGTRNGIFVQSPDGITQEAKFDVKNSPLLSNKVTDLGFNPATGEMIIISGGGIQSYKTESLGGGRSHDSNVYAYPNPVRPDYQGPIAIKGLVRDASVKITDINGKLVFETKALGGQAIWDGNDYNGVRASTGVYLVFSANENTALSSEALVTKILLVQ